MNAARSIGRLSALVVVALKFVGPCIERDTSAAGTAGRSLITVANDIELSRLVELTSAAVGASIEYQPAELSKRVTLRLREAMSPTDLWDAMAATLEANVVVLMDTGKPGLSNALDAARARQAPRTRLLDPPVGIEEQTFVPPRPLPLPVLCVGSVWSPQWLCKGVPDA